MIFVAEQKREIVILNAERRERERIALEEKKRHAAVMRRLLEERFGVPNEE